MIISTNDSTLRKAINGVIKFVIAYPNTPHFFQSQIPMMKMSSIMETPIIAAVKKSIFVIKAGRINQTTESEIMITYPSQYLKQLPCSFVSLDTEW